MLSFYGVIAIDLGLLPVAKGDPGTEFEIRAP